MKLKILLLIMICIAFLASCSRYITPYEAANGKAKCGKMVR
ncbi:MAG: hypothetical protein ACJ751_26845 [Niastella sp.]